MPLGTFARVRLALSLVALLFAPLIALSQNSPPASVSTANRKAPQSASDMPASSDEFRPTVLLDVISTDPQDRPVFGLKEDEFQVVEKIDWATEVPEKISSFRAVDKARIGLGEPRLSWRTPPELRGNRPAFYEPSDPLTILVLDTLNTDISTQVVREEITTLADFDCDHFPADLVCQNLPYSVLRLGKKLELLQDFNSDRYMLLSTLHKAFDDLPTAPELVDPNAPVTAAAAADSGSSSLSPIRDWDRVPHTSGDLARRAQMTMDALRAIARHLAGYPGRKRLIWVSSRFPFSIAPDACANGTGDAASCDSPAALVMNALSRARISVYPIQPRTASLLSGKNLFHAQQQADLAAAPVEESLEDSSAFTAMRVFAAQTGGHTCRDSERTADCFDRVLREGILDYEIAYSPSVENWTAGFHRIAVKTKHAHVQLSFPLYYFVQSARPAGADLDLKQAACDDLMTSTALNLTAELQSAPSQPAKYWLQVDGSRLTASTSPADSRQLRLHLDLAVCTFDARGAPLQHVQYSASQDMSPQKFESVRQHGLARIVDFQPIERTALLRWVVRDAQTGDLGSVDLPYHPPVTPVVADADTVDHPAAAAPTPSPAQQVSPAAQVASPPSSTVPDVSMPDAYAEIRPYCAAISKTTDHSPALADLCLFTLSLSRKLPNVICDLKTDRYWHSYMMPHRDVVTANVTYENGHEHYDNIKINGSTPNFGSGAIHSSWSNGEFATLLQILFSPASNAEFFFSAEAKLHSTPALVFTFQVDQADNLLYYVQARYQNGSVVTLFPSYQGRIWLNKANFQLMRMEKETVGLSHGSPITRVTTQIDYSNVPLGDGSSFVLPLKSEVETCSQGEGAECSHNVVRFSNWHKFGAKSRILPAPPQ